MVRVLTGVPCTLPLSKGVPYCNTDGGVSDRDVGDGPTCEVELRGGFLVAFIPHPQQTACFLLDASDP
jgi:hypothetical protein